MSIDAKSYKPRKILDNGYVQLVDTWGSDISIVEAARMSTNKGFKGWGTEDTPGDEKLLRYLYENQHATPFEMAGMVIEVGAPIFVFREWHRHRTQSYNELSARYVPMPNENYLPTMERIIDGAAATGNKQATGNCQETREAAPETTNRTKAHHRPGTALPAPYTPDRLVSGNAAWPTCGAR